VLNDLLAVEAEETAHNLLEGHVQDVQGARSVLGSSKMVKNKRNHSKQAKEQEFGAREACYKVLEVIPRPKWRWFKYVQL
jgi:predicted ATP-grasp superfamily ATP-dependent carboligase